ncbi:MAG TPA: efflux RND transporter periplasmic adaptor subunit [Candidatus Krumholzibacteria bacterium]|nr:efflux RND transporter periplasmic adaptor subunit [Candidatus Krumholzibacteria bacterium]
MACIPLLGGCGKNGSAEQAQGGAGGGPGGAPKEAPVPVAISAAVTGEIASYYTATATLSAEKEAQILSRVAGVVQKRMCEEGDIVAEGAELLLIDNDEYRYRYEQAEAARADLESRMRRMEQMKEQELVSPEEYETVSNDLAAARAAEGMAKLDLSYTRVTAPFRGRVVSRMVDVGQTVSVGTPLFALSDFTPLLARVHVPAKEFNKLEPDQPVDLVLESTGQRLRGRIMLVSPTIDPTTGTIKITIEIPTYPDGVRPGDFAQVSIVTERRRDRTLIPKVALINDRGEQVVFVSADSTAERRVVEVGFQDENNAEILDGVNTGERVIVKGQRSLKNGGAIKILDTEAAQASDSISARDGS